jgi:hypothetical protein
MGETRSPEGYFDYFESICQSATDFDRMGEITANTHPCSTRVVSGHGFPTSPTVSMRSSKTYYRFTEMGIYVAVVGKGLETDKAETWILLLAGCHAKLTKRDDQSPTSSSPVMTARYTMYVQKALNLNKGVNSVFPRLCAIQLR